MAQPTGIISADGGRLDASLGTVLAAGNVALGAGWGAGTVAITEGSNDQAGVLTVTAVTGGGLAQATATITVTFADGAYLFAPVVLATVTSTSSIDEGHVVATSTTTGFVLTFSVLPVTTKLYRFTYAVIGKKAGATT